MISWLVLKVHIISMQLIRGVPQYSTCAAESMIHGRGFLHLAVRSCKGVKYARQDGGFNVVYHQSELHTWQFELINNLLIVLMKQINVVCWWSLPGLFFNQLSHIILG